MEIMPSHVNVNDRVKPRLGHGAPEFVRIWWASEHKWASAKVDRVTRNHGSELRVELTFTEEDASGVVTAADALFAYAL
jgi:hypothetical protein